MFRYATHALDDLREQLQRTIDCSDDEFLKQDEKLDDEVGEGQEEISFEKWKMRPAASEAARGHTLAELFLVDNPSLQLEHALRTNIEQEFRAAWRTLQHQEISVRRRKQHEAAIACQSSSEQVSACEYRARQRKLRDRIASDEANRDNKARAERLRAAVAAQAAKEEARRSEERRIAERQRDSRMKVAREIEEAREARCRNQIEADAQHEVQFLRLQLEPILQHLRFK